MLDANHEAAFLAFTEVVTPSGVKLHMTAREGMTVGNLVSFIQNYDEVIHVLAERRTTIDGQTNDRSTSRR